jgi:protein-S-isoprenylcysteine O-methyltransferase Ste14
VNRSTVVVVVVTFVLGVLAGLALAEWLVSAGTAIAVALVLVAIGLIAYFLIRRRLGGREQPGRADKPPAVA